MKQMDIQEKAVEAAFSRQSVVFDQIDQENSIIGWMRNRIRDEVLSFLSPGMRMLELNCGTGLDAMFFAGKGIHIHATDQSEGMLKAFEKRLSGSGLENQIGMEKCSFNELEQLRSTQEFDYVFSNFGGLNCTDRLDKVLRDIDHLLKPGGRFTLVLMPRICPWELLLLFRGYFKTALRRLRRSGASAKVEGLPFQCYYYDPSYVIRHCGASYRILSLKALSLTVPPPYMEGFREKHPHAFRRLESIENALHRRWPFNRWGDHYMITMEKKEGVD